MWYPNRLQWRVIWIMAIGWTLIKVNDLDYRPERFIYALLIDGVILVWWFNRPKTAPDAKRDERV